MNFDLKQGDWSTLAPLAMPVRREVFIVEQGVPEALEWDADDALSLHVVALAHDGQALGTARLLPDGHIGRMAVRRRARGCGVGSAMLQTLIDAAGARGDDRLALHAQSHATGFYARFGFVPEGDEFDEAGIAHRLMWRVLQVRS